MSFDEVLDDNTRFYTDADGNRRQRHADLSDGSPYAAAARDRQESPEEPSGHEFGRLDEPARHCQYCGHPVGLQFRRQYGISGKHDVVVYACVHCVQDRTELRRGAGRDPDWTPGDYAIRHNSREESARKQPIADGGDR